MDKVLKNLKIAVIFMTIAVALMIVLMFIKVNQVGSSKLGDSGFPQFFSSATMSSAAVSASTSTQVVAVNNVRTYLSICNDSANKVWLSFGGAAVVTSGYVMAANTCLIMNNNVFVGRINAIASSSTSSLITIEK